MCWWPSSLHNQRRCAPPMWNIKVKCSKHSLVDGINAPSRLPCLQLSSFHSANPIFSYFNSSKLKPSETLIGFSRIIQVCVIRRLKSFLKSSTTNFGPLKFWVLHGSESCKEKDSSKEPTFTGRDAQQPAHLMEVTLKSMTTCLPWCYSQLRLTWNHRWAILLLLPF